MVYTINYTAVSHAGLQITELKRISLFVCLFFVFFLFNAIFQHNIGYKWRPILMAEEEIGQPPERTADPREATGKLSHITTFAES